MRRKTCAEAHQKMYSYLDGEIGFFRRMRIRRHLRRCPSCNGGFTFETKLKTRIREGCSDEMPRELFDRLAASLRRSDADGEVG